MEYPLTEEVYAKSEPGQYVLILILMEYPLTISRSHEYGQEVCLNPYSNGIPSDYLFLGYASILLRCLNPYSNGIPSDHNLEKIDIYDPES